MSSQEAQASHHEDSLTSILSLQQRTSLTRLLAEATARMRQSIEANLTAPTSSETVPEAEPSHPNIGQTGSGDDRQREQKLLELRAKELSAPSMLELKTAVLAHFDEWRVAMIKRVGEVVHTPAKAAAQLESANTPAAVPPAPDEALSLDTAGVTARADETAELATLYPPIDTPLSTLPESQRVLVLHSVLLLLLSLEHYSAYSRVVLLWLTSSLALPLARLRHSEETTARSLLSAANALSGVDETRQKADEHAHSRAWKVGFATVAGAAVIGLTGGLAAPLVAAGVGSVMGGLGLGATAAAGYLGSMAGSTVLVGSLFGAYGGRMSGQVMDKYAKEVQDFAFLPVGRETRKSSTKTTDDEAQTASEDEQAARTTNHSGKHALAADPAGRRLRVTIGISGWLTEPDEVVTPWRVIGHGAEVFALRFELEALLNLGHSMTSMVHSAAWGYAKKEILKRTILADMMLALWPLGLMKISRVVDNPFSIALARSEKAGELLADALIHRAQGERPVTLVGYSLGARVIYTCLLRLAQRRAFGLVESAVLIGAPTPSTPAAWRTMRSAVAARLVNVFSTNDYVLGFLYRTSSIQLGVAGLQAIEAVPGVENVDVSDSVSGHLRYRFLVGRLLKGIGFEDVLVDEVEREEEAAAAAEMRDSKTDSTSEDSTKDSTKASPADSTADSTTDSKSQPPAEHEDPQQLEKDVEAKTRQSLLKSTMASLHLSDEPRRSGPNDDSIGQ